ncbi:hypothetical protein [uncultured Bacteroides sp.]|uniref:hypothetical protein n=1 Tax=uncultured Bacteroides sp. TaxID=162156 RepID=UPI002AA7B332|nr:hypothetical protein [uncultured Bacteroides sp.]
MKRFASHYLLLPGYGLLKQYVIETEGEYVIRVFSLSEESECVQWMPGVTFLFPKQEGELFRKQPALLLNDVFSLPLNNFRLDAVPTDLANELVVRKLSAYRLYPFDFKTMLPDERTKVTLLF